MDFEKIVEIAELAGEAILEIYNRSNEIEIKHKGDNSPLTEADLAAHNLIVQELKKIDQTPIVSSNWEMLWSDEFDGEELDLSKWNKLRWKPGWVNNELQAYTDRDTNVFIEDGYLVLQGNIEPGYSGTDSLKRVINPLLHFVLTDARTKRVDWSQCWL